MPQESQVFSQSVNEFGPAQPTTSVSAKSGVTVSTIRRRNPCRSAKEGMGENLLDILRKIK